MNASPDQELAAEGLEAPQVSNSHPRRPACSGQSLSTILGVYSLAHAPRTGLYEQEGLTVSLGGKWRRCTIFLISCTRAVPMVTERCLQLLQKGLDGCLWSVPNEFQRDMQLFCSDQAAISLSIGLQVLQLLP